MARRKRTPKPKPGELIVYYGYGEDRYDGPDVCYAWGGAGASKADGSLVHGMLSGYSWRKSDSPIIKHDGYLKELEARGYDLSTLKFSIQMKKKPDEEATTPA